MLATGNSMASAFYPCLSSLWKFQESGESRVGGSEKDLHFLKIPKRHDKLVLEYKQGKFVSYFLDNDAKICFSD